MGTETRTSENPIASGNQKVAFPAAEIDKRTAEQKAIDDWLPITSSRNAKWWYSAFHNVTAMVGAGVLSLPSAMASLGWGPGVVILVLSWIITLYTLWQMVEMHEMIPGKRFDRYHELGQHAFGEKLGLWIVVPQQLICEVGDVAFAYAGHNVVLEIQATIPSSPEKPSKGPMWRGVLIAYLVVGLCYFPVALVGYWVFGNSVDDNILITLNKPTWLIVTANMFVVIHVIGSYQLYAMPVFDMIETVMVKKLHFEPSWLLRFVVRNVYVGSSAYLGSPIGSALYLVSYS
ncbi:hypothetical protein JHK87_052913 [Glycine soja]|nr:hypothetical protein JHK87_052913 [Glycine soja]